MQIIYAHTLDIGKPSTAINFVFFNCLALARRGATVHLIMSNSGTQDAKQLLQNHFEEEIPENLHIYAYHYNKKGHYYLYKTMLKKVRDLMTPNTIFITRTIGILPHLYLFGRLGFKLNVFFELHDFFYSLKLKNAPIKNLIPYKKRFYERYFLKHTKGIICLNSAYKELYKNYFPESKLHVFHTGLNNIIKNTFPRKNQIVYIGSVDNKKYAISEIFKVASYTQNNIKFIIIGGQDEKQIQKLKQQAVNHHLENKVEITGWTSRQKISEILQESKIGIMALRNTFSNRHSIPLKMLDYISHGLPVIAPNYHAFHEIITDNKHGFYIDWESQHKEIAAKIEGLMENEELYAQISANVYQKAEELTWNKRAEKQINFFNDFLQKQTQ